MELKIEYYFSIIIFKNNQVELNSINYNIVRKKILSPSEHEQINCLWNIEYPLNLKDRYSLLLEGASDYNHYVIYDTDGIVSAWAVDFEKEGEIRISIIVDSKCSNKGMGSALIQELKKNNPVFYAWVIDHNRHLKSDNSAYLSPMNFYLKHGFTILHEQRIDTEIISAVKIMWRH